MNDLKSLIHKLMFVGIDHSCHCYCNNGEFDSYGVDCKDSKIGDRCHPGKGEYWSGIRREFTFNRKEFDRLYGDIFSKEECDILENILNQ